jgi:HSP20 family molecular chaperone IbpA
MSTFRSRSLTWSQALDALVQAERLGVQAFAPRSIGGRGPQWEPPIDVIETENEVLILSAMPGVDPDAIDVTLHESGFLTIRGHRAMPRELAHAHIHRLELPQGCFERRIALPPGHYGAVARETVNNCLVIRLAKIV